MNLQAHVQQSALKLNEPVLVAVSGGADSVVLANVLHQLGVPMAIAHCNFQLRGAEADKDETLVKQLATNLGCEFHVIRFNTTNYAQTRKVSIQMAARDLRYKWFDKLCHQHGYAQIVVGTHLTDSIETFLFNAAKGTGIAGLRGIKGLNQKVVRPFIRVTKQEIYAYANTHQLAYREDASNAEIKYARNKIRHKVLPVLQEINPDLEHTFARNFERLQRTENYLHAKLQADWEQLAHWHEEELIIHTQSVKQMPFVREVLNYGLQEFGFTDTQIANVITAQTGAVFTSKMYTLTVQQNQWVMLKTPDEVATGVVHIREFLGEITQPVHLVFKDDFVHQVTIDKNPKHAFFDFDALTFPLVLRPWKAGDVIQPFGMKGTKKVSDIINEAKIPLPKKPLVYVLESNRTIIWVVGLRAANTFKVTPKTQRIYAIESHSTK